MTARLKWCIRCRGSGISRASTSRRWVACVCGRNASSEGMAKLAAQEKLDKRFQEIKEGKW